MMSHKFTVLNQIKQHAIVSRFGWITFSILLILILVLFLPWQQTAKGTGVLTALNPVERNYNVVATVNGFIDAFYVKENQFVKKGDKLFQMRDLDEKYHERLLSIKEQTQQNLTNENTKLENLKENLDSQKKVYSIGMKTYDSKILNLKNSLNALHVQKNALLNKQKIELVNYQRSLSLYQDGIQSKRDIELKESLYLSVKANYQRTLADIKNIKNSIEIANNDKTSFSKEMELKINSVKNNILSSKSILNSLNKSIAKESLSIARYQSRDIVAKTDGYVVNIYQNDQNRLLKSGEKVLFFAPVVTQRSIMLKISDFNMPLIKSGLKVRLIFYGWPAVQISGWPKIKHGTYGGVIKYIENVSREKGYYYAVIMEDKNDDPWPEENYLKVGTQTTAWVTMNEVTLGYEIWRLILAQPPQMSTPVEEI